LIDTENGYGINSSDDAAELLWELETSLRGAIGDLCAALDSLVIRYSKKPRM
jgi:hypothetical protein